jgi:hypothetical protein
MIVLSDMELKILKAIVESHTFDFVTARDVYIKTKSFDRTIEIIEYSASYAISPYTFLK